MVPPVEGLNATDVALLRFLAGHEAPHFEAPPTLIADHIGAASSTVHRRLSRLVAAELVVESTEHTSGRYAITELGERYLRSDLTGDDLDNIEARIDAYTD